MRIVAILLVAALALLTVPGTSASGVTFCDDGSVTVTVGARDVVTCFAPSTEPDDVFRFESCYGGAGFRYVVLDKYESPCYV